jgi:hypothetical protein
MAYANGRGSDWGARSIIQEVGCGKDGIFVDSVEREVRVYPSTMASPAWSLRENLSTNQRNG